MINKLCVLTLFSLAVVSCKKEETTIPPPAASFTAAGSVGNYYIQNDPASVFKIPVGFTTASNAERKVTYTVTSPSGAAAGTQYAIASSGTLTIPAGKTVDSINVKGLFAGYATGRKDTLVFKLTGGDGVPASWSNTYTLTLQKYCPVNVTTFTGTYIAQDYDAGTNQPDGGPYAVTLTPGANTGNSGTIAVRGLWGVTSPFTVSMNWADPANFSTNIADQNWFVDGTYGQAKIRANGSGSFSSCDNTLVLRYEAYVSAGSFGKYYTTLRK